MFLFKKSQSHKNHKLWANQLKKEFKQQYSSVLYTSDLDSKIYKMFSNLGWLGFGGGDRGTATRCLATGINTITVVNDREITFYKNKYKNK